MKTTFISVKCNILSGAFPGERVFEVTTTIGEIDGIAPVGYCANQDGMPIGPMEPAKDQRLSGWVNARVIRNGGNSALVLFPDGEKAEVNLELIKERAENFNVPLGR